MKVAFSRYPWPSLSESFAIKIVFSIHGWESVDGEGQVHALFCAVLYKKVEHLWALLSEVGGGLGHIRLGFQRPAMPVLVQSA